jgi:transcription elongation factor GreA
MMAFLFVFSKGSVGGCMGEHNGSVYLTRERLVELENELRLLKGAGRTEIAQKIADARSYGDLSENAEYDAAKEAQQHHELKIAKIEETLSRARILEPSKLQDDKVYILSLVKIQDMKTKEVIEYRLVSPEEADFDKNKISISSPIGKGLMGRKKGEVINIKAPAGSLSYKILEISH